MSDRWVPPCSLALIALLVPGLAAGAVQRRTFSMPGAYLVVEVLTDDLVHFETSAIGSGPAPGVALYTSPMILETSFGGPSAFSATGNVVETPHVRVAVDTGTLCVEVDDKTKGSARLATFCPVDLGQASKGLSIDSPAMNQVYGLGQQFKSERLGSADGDWLTLGVREGIDSLGNGFAGFQDAAVGNVQMPVYFAAGAGGLNYGVLLDNVYWQRWDFGASPWQVRMFGDQIRWYVMTGRDLPQLRAEFMALAGRPPVPPRKAFGLWVSEFGYRNFGQIDTLLAGLRRDGFPVDGFVLDLNWFGGVVLGDPAKSTMGRLNWDEDQSVPAILQTNPYSFTNPGSKIKAYADDDVALVAIEESYLSNATDTFAAMPADLTAYRPTGGTCDPTRQTQPAEVSGFWGTGRMIDWSDPQAGVWISDNRRFPNLSKLGVHGHWTDLGEPENKDTTACYEGVETTVSGLKNRHSDVHNLYNLLWNRSIWDGYVAHQGQADDLGVTRPRPFIMTRSGAVGSQRYGAAFWSGDIAGNLESLATHYNAQMHMSFSGIDYYGADVGGFRREVLPYNDKTGRYRGFEEEEFTQWFADAAWTDVPLRPHTDKEFVKTDPPYATAPNLVGKMSSNRANVRQRYELIPYYYSLAHRAFETGSPVVTAPAFYHQNDPALRGVGHQKMIGRDVMVGIVARHGEYARDVYLPQGRWANYHTNEWVEGPGQVVRNVPVYRDGILRIPVFARGGAILPKMTVDADTKDAFGHERAGASPHEELVARVYADPAASAFTLYEDDGRTLRYDASGRPSYQHRRTPITQQQTGPQSVRVRIGPAANVNGPTFPGAVTTRQNVVELVVADARATAVTLDGAALPGHGTLGAYAAASSGWVNAGHNLILAKSAPRAVGSAKTFVFTLQPVAPTTSVQFVCDDGVTQPGQSIFVVGSIPSLGNWQPAQAIKLNPDVYYQYIWAPPSGGQDEGPKEPVWTAVVGGLPPTPSFEWKCIRMNDDRSGEPVWEGGANNVVSNTVASGYAGQGYGQF